MLAAVCGKSTELWAGAELDPELAASRILVVDDSLTVRKMIVQYLHRGGFTSIVEASNGREALVELAKQTPDIIITDLFMPEMDGHELIGRIRADERYATIPILVETGAMDPDDRGSVFLQGATDLISKPINPREMLGRIRVHLEQRRLVRRLSDYQQSLAQDLDLAREMQESLMPARAELDALEARFNIDIASAYKASQGLGGDIWSISAPSDHELHLWMVDFAGHGVSAALNTFRFHAMLRSERVGRLPLHDALLAMNGTLGATLPRGQFATVLGLRISLADRSLEVVSAAAPPLILRVGREGRFQAIEVPGFPLGLVPNATFTVSRYPFPPGSALVAYSDALIETPVEPNSIFSPARLAEMFEHSGKHADAASLQRKALGGIEPYLLEDDLTFVAIRDRSIG